MSKREYKTEQQSSDELLAYYTSNQSVTDLVSGQIFTSSTYFTSPNYIQDPEDSSVYCCRKTSGQYMFRPPLVIYKNNKWNYITNYYTGSELFCSRRNNLLVEFDIYIANNTTYRVIITEGDPVAYNGNNGYALRIDGSSMYIYYCNNSSTVTKYRLCNLSDVCNIWNHVLIRYTPNDTLTACKITIIVSNVNNTYSFEYTFNNQTSTIEKRFLTAASYHYGRYAAVQDIYDYFKEIKIWKVND